MEKRYQQGGDMRAIDISVGHDDDFFIAQPRLVIRASHAAPQRQHKVSDLLALLHFCGRSIGDVEDFTAQRQNCLIAPIAPLFGRATRTIALNNKQLGAIA